MNFQAHVKRWRIILCGMILINFDKIKLRGKQVCGCAESNESVWRVERCWGAYFVVLRARKCAFVELNKHVFLYGRVEGFARVWNCVVWFKARQWWFLPLRAG